jgi:peptide/nickel transport system permease protein
MKTLRTYIVTRILLTIPMLLILVTLVFFIVRIMPGDPVEAMLRPGVPQEYKDALKHNLGLDLPLFLNFRGSFAEVKPPRLFLQNAAGPSGIKILQVEQGLRMEVSRRTDEEDSADLAGTGDWLQVVIPENWVGWVSPDQMDWMRQVNTEMTVLDEGVLPGTESWTHFEAPDGPVGTEVNAIWGEPSGLLWFGTDEGVTRYSTTGWDLFDETAGKYVTTAWSERPADLWFGTQADGLLHIRSNRWEAFTTEDGLPSNQILSVWGSGSREVWAGTDQGAARYNGRRWETDTASEGLVGQNVRAIWGDGQDTYWFGTEAGLSRYDGDTWTTFTTSDGLPSDQVLALWGGQQGTLWIGTEGGLTELKIPEDGSDDSAKWTTYTVEDGLVSLRINVIYGNEDFASGRRGTLWVGTLDGASAYDGVEWTSYTSATGLASDDVRAIWEDIDGQLWVGTAAGLNRFDSRPWIELSVPEGGMVGWAPVDQFEVQIRPLDSQYFNYLGALLQGDLGESMAPTKGRPIIEDLKLKFPATLELAIASLTVTILIGVPLGAIAANRRRSPTDYGSRIFSIVIYAVPVFWLGMMFQLVFGVYLGDWYESSAFAQQYLYPIFKDFLPLPISGRIGTEMAPERITGLYILDSILTLNWDSLVSALRYLTLPAFTLGLYLSGVFIRLTRTNMLDTLQEDYITAARARGIKERVVVYSHGLKNAFIPILTMMGLQFAALLAGAVLTETTFSWPGMGLFMWERIGYRDFNSIQGSVVFFALLVAAVSLLVDIIYAWIDPRIRY